MLLIVFNLVMTGTITAVKLTDRPDKILEFVGGTVDISVGRYVFLIIFTKYLPLCHLLVYRLQ